MDELAPQVKPLSSVTGIHAPAGWEGTCWKLVLPGGARTSSAWSGSDRVWCCLSRSAEGLDGSAGRVGVAALTPSMLPA